jgi:pSer/pThr/pTyr-binding forkhead associated (FHA) protein
MGAGPPRMVSQTGIGRLVVVGPGGHRSEHDLTTDPTSVGRARQSLIRLSASSVSRNHAEIVLRKGQVAVVDLGSTRGTQVNGERLAVHQPFPIRDGDRLQIGPYTLTYLASPAASSSLTRTMMGNGQAVGEPAGQPRALDLSARRSLTIGREPGTTCP